MLYLVPTWENRIYDTAGDGITSLLRMFLRNEEPVQLLVTELLPNLRYQLNENGLLGIKVHRIWDDVLGIHLDEGLPIDFEALNLPETASFVYLGQEVIVNDHDQFFARIQVNPNGLIQKVTFAESQDHRVRVDEYDDRGFMITSKILATNSQQILEQSWFNEMRQRVMTFDAQKPVLERVRVLKDKLGLGQMTFATVSEVIQQATQIFFSRQTSHEANAILAQWSAVNQAVLIGSQSVTLTFLLDDATHIQDSELTLLLAQVHQLVVTSEGEQTKLRRRASAEDSPKIRVGYPYFTSLQLGNSNEENQMIMYLQTATDEYRLEQMLPVILDRIFEHDQESVEIATELDLGIIARLVANNVQARFLTLERLDEGLIRTIISSQDQAEIFRAYQQLFARDMDTDESGNPIDETRSEVLTDDQAMQTTILQTLSKIKAHGPLNDSELSKRFNDVRIFIDLAPEPQKYSQFKAISAGIPQLLAETNELAVDRINGWQVTDADSLREGLDYYLTGLKMWNQSLVYSVELIQQYMFDNQTQFWKDRIFKNGKNKETHSLR